MIFIVNNRGNNDPFINLAVEDYLLRFSDKTFLFIYVNSPSVIVGRNQNIYEEANVKFVMENGINIVRRISGGGTVCHDEGNLSYSVISDYKRELYNNYENFSQPTISLLQKLNLDAKLNDRNDIVINAKKISGVAQFTSRNRMITHGTLLFNSDLSMLSRSLRVNQKEFISKSTKSKRSPVTNIAEELQETISINEFKKLLIEEFSNYYNGVQEYNFDDGQWFKIQESAETKFKSWNWIYERIPKFEIKRQRIIDGDNFNLFMKVDKGLISEVKIESERNISELDSLQKNLLGRKYVYYEIKNLIEKQNFIQKKILDLFF